jgi:hypothetical protein
LLGVLLAGLTVASASAGCANRGMTVSSRDGGGGNSGADLRLDLTDALADTGSDSDAFASETAREVMYEAAPLPCATRFNFEMNMIHGARLNPPGAFMSLAHSGRHTSCGLGALEIMARFMGIMGDNARGIVLIDLMPPENLAGKMFSIRGAADPPVTPGPTLSVSLVTPGGYVDLLPVIRPLPGGYQKQDYLVPARATSVSQISIQVSDSNNYEGRIYIDEIDIK